MGPASVSLSGTGWSLSAPPFIKSVPAIVPNDIADDLERANLLPDLWFGTNAMNASRWIWERDWVLTRHFPTPSGPIATSTWISFDGVDYNCSVRLNGRWIGSHVGAFEPFELEATGALLPQGSPRNNTLEVTLLRPPHFILENL